MSELASEQQKLFSKFIKILKDEKSVKLLNNFFQKIEDNSLETALTNCNHISIIYNGDENSESLNETRKDIEISQKHINEIYYEIFDKENGENERNSSTVLDEIKKAKELVSKLRTDYQKFYGTKDTEGNIIKGILAKLDEACDQIENSQEKLDELDEYYDKIFNGTDNNKPLQEHLQILDKQLQDLSKKYEQDFTNLYQDKKEPIETLETLMPSATSVGLASAYQKEKDKIQESIKSWNSVFKCSVVIFILVFALYFWLSFDEKFSYVSFLKSLPLWIFSGFFSFYATKQIGEYKRLASKYAHKKTLNTTYTAYKNKIDNQDNDDLKEKLQRIMLESAKFNPSTTLNGNNVEIPSATFLEKIIENLPLDSLNKLQEKIGSMISKIEKQK